MTDSDLGGRLSVSLVDVSEGREAEFHALSGDFEALFARKEYGRSEVIRDEGLRRRFYAVRRWKDAAAAEQCHADKEAQALTSRCIRWLGSLTSSTACESQIRRGSWSTSGGPGRKPDRRTGFDRRRTNVGRAEGDRREDRDRRLGPRRLRSQGGDVDLVAAARRAGEHADAAFSNFKVGAALEAADGTVFAGCNIRERDLWPGDLRRARGHVQSAFRRV